MPRKAEIFFDEAVSFDEANLKTRNGLTASAKAGSSPGQVKLGIQLANVEWSAESLFDLSDFIEEVAVSVAKAAKKQPQ